MHHQGRLGVVGNADDVAGVVFTDWKGRVLDPSGRPIFRSLRWSIAGAIQTLTVGIGHAERKVLQHAGTGRGRRGGRDLVRTS